MALGRHELRSFLVETGRFSPSEIDELLGRSDAFGRMAAAGRTDLLRSVFGPTLRAQIARERLLRLTRNRRSPHSSSMDETPSRGEVEAQIG